MSIFGKLFGKRSRQEFALETLEKLETEQINPIFFDAILKNIANRVLNEEELASLIKALRVRAETDPLFNKALEACVAFKEGKIGKRKCFKCDTEWSSLHFAMIEKDVYKTELWDIPERKIRGLTCNKCGQSYCVKCLLKILPFQYYPGGFESSARQGLIVHGRCSYGSTCQGQLFDK